MSPNSSNSLNGFRCVVYSRQAEVPGTIDWSQGETKRERVVFLFLTGPPGHSDTGGTVCRDYTPLRVEDQDRLVSERLTVNGTHPLLHEVHFSRTVDRPLHPPSVIS